MGITLADSASMLPWEVLLIGGSSGTGKTLATQEVGQRLGVSVLQADDVRLAIPQWLLRMRVEELQAQRERRIEAIGATIFEVSGDERSDTIREGYMGTSLGLMVVAALSTGLSVGIVAAAWVVVIVVVAVQQVVHRRRESSRQAERLDRLGTKRTGNDSPQRERR
jgi:hypothetical protein